MFIGHGLLAFAIAASVASARGWGADRALTVGAVAGLFGTLPDIDMVYAVLGVLSGAEGLFAASDAFWEAASVVHRAVTHSLVVGVVAAVGFAAWRARQSRLALVFAVTLLTGLTLSVGYFGGPIGGIIIGVFVLGGLGIVWVARSAEFGPQTVCLTALLGLFTHPFGDLLTGSPPKLLYPFEWTLLTERVTLHADPTIHLLSAFFVELAAIWLGLLVYARLRGWPIRPLVARRAGLGVGYAGAIFAIPAPTLELSWPFVLSVLGMGLVAVPVRLQSNGSRHWQTVVTAITAVTLAGLAYTVAYLVV